MQTRDQNLIFVVLVCYVAFRSGVWENPGYTHKFLQKKIIWLSREACVRHRFQQHQNVTGHTGVPHSCCQRNNRITLLCFAFSPWH